MGSTGFVAYVLPFLRILALLRISLLCHSDSSDKSEPQG